MLAMYIINKTANLAMSWVGATTWLYIFDAWF